MLRMKQGIQKCPQTSQNFSPPSRLTHLLLTLLPTPRELGSTTELNQIELLLRLNCQWLTSFKNGVGALQNLDLTHVR